MQGRLGGTGEALRSPFPWIAFSAIMALAFAAWFSIERSRYEDARQLFERRAENAAAALRARLVLFEQVLRSGAARVASSPTLTREEWRKFISHQQLSDRIPGLQ